MSGLHVGSDTPSQAHRAESKLGLPEVTTPSPGPRDHDALSAHEELKSPLPLSARQKEEESGLGYSQDTHTAGMKHYWTKEEVRQASEPA
jgi:hypothetical protein